MKKTSRKKKSSSKQIPTIITMDIGKAVAEFVEKKTPETKVPKLCVCPLIRA
ncbi:MAG: hypothetical protein R2877_07435 [Bdellovibrionota bacterium]